MRRILMSVFTISVVSVVAFGATRAFFSDKETSEGNTFTAGTLDLIIDLDGKWTNPWVGPFFAVDDMKPGDQVEKTLSFYVDNDAWLCAYITKENYENGCTEPESSAPSSDPTCEAPGAGQGELGANAEVLVWYDEGAEQGWQCSGTPKCSDDPTEGDNIRQIDYGYGGEWILFNGTGNELGTRWNKPLPWPVPKGEHSYVGVKFCVGDLDPATFKCNGAGVGNIIQSDSYSADISFYAEQSRNNDGFVCPATP